MYFFPYACLVCCRCYGAQRRYHEITYCYILRNMYHTMHSILLHFVAYEFNRCS